MLKLAKFLRMELSAPGKGLVHCMDRAEAVTKILMATMGLDDETLYRSSERWRGAVRGAVNATRLCKEIKLAATPLLQSHVERLLKKRWLCREQEDSQSASTTLQSTGQLLAFSGVVRTHPR